MNVLLIDNLDSFTFNLVESFERLGCDVQVLRNTVPAAEALRIAEDRNALITLSPGPGTPREAGCCLELIAIAKRRVPLLGICLGHQSIVMEAGGKVVRAPEPVHGKSHLLAHNGLGPCEGLPDPIRIGRYHSLCTRELPPRLHVHAEIEGMAMIIADADARQFGLQFHPESVLTPQGDLILRNILAAADRHPGESRDPLSAALVA